MHILWLKTELLHPIDKGGKIRTYHTLRELSRRHRITYLTLDDGDGSSDALDRAGEYCDRVVRVPFHAHPKFSAGFYLDLLRNLFSPLPYFVAKYRSAEMRRAIAELSRREDFDLVVCDFLVPSVNLPDRLRCPTVLFQHNVEAMIWERHQAVQKNPVKRLFLYGQWRKARAFERTMCGRFDRVIAVSETDAAAIRRDYGVEAMDVPTGVDLDYFQPGGEEIRQANSLLFTGSMDWLPNVDAVCFFAAEVLPHIREVIPDVSLWVVGREPHPSVLALAGRDPAIRVTGRVDDVRPYMERAAAYVIPLRIGGGTRLKVYEAMAMGMPIVSTAIGAEGLPLRNGVELLLADSPREFANAVVRVLRQPELAEGLRSEAARAARQRFGWEAAVRSFEEICRETAEISPRGARKARSGRESIPAPRDTVRSPA